MANELLFQTPIGGVPYQDWTIVNYVDLEPGSSIEDFRGGNYTYNGHNAIDFTLPHFEAMDSGVPIYASLPGTVTRVSDVYPDRCSTENPCSTPANLIEIDHGDGLITRYLHLRQDSASVSVGQFVDAGQQIALVGSSGNSSDAHLHFEVYQNGDVIEINTPGDEFLWQSPIPYAGDVVGSLDHDITDHSPSFPELRERPETVDTFLQQPGITPHIWTHLHGIDQGDDLDFYFSQPDGNEYAHWHWSAPQISYGWWIAAINLPDEPDLGVWEVEFQHNGSTILTDTFTVVPELLFETLTVDTLVDENDGNFSAGDLSLREAIALISDGGTINFEPSLAGTITLDSSLGQLEIDKSLTIDGLGADVITVSGNDWVRVFDVDDDNSTNQIEVVIDGLTIRDGNTGNGSFPEINGGGFFNQENLTITNSAIINNEAGNGGAIYNSASGQLQLENSLVSENLNGTGPIFNDGGLASISNTTISDHAVAGIGAIVNTGGGELRLANSTITNNDSFDAAVFNGEDSTAIVSNTIIAGNRGDIIPERDDVIGTFISNGYNLIGNGNGSNGFDSLGDQVGTNENPIDPLLSPLQDNGGSTQTYGLFAGSPAIDAGDPDFEPPPEFDQRGAGFPRVVDGDGDGIATVDIGAFELINIIDGTSGNDSLVGTPGSDRILGFDGNDLLIGRNSDDSLLGGDGRDVLVGETGDDFLDGGADNDNLIGSSGTDRFVLRQGDGRDTIFDYLDGTDSFLLDDGLAFEDLVITQGVGQSLISVTDTNEELVVLFGVNASDIGVEDFSTLVEF